MTLYQITSDVTRDVTSLLVREGKSFLTQNCSPKKYAKLKTSLKRLLKVINCMKMTRERRERKDVEESRLKSALKI